MDKTWTKHGQNMDMYQSRKADFIKTPLLSLASMTPMILIQFNDAPPWGIPPDNTKKTD